MAAFTASAFILLTVLFASSEVKSSVNSAKDFIGHAWKLQASSKPNHYIRHKNFLVRLDKFEDSESFEWNVVKGLCGSGISFQSKNYPNYYLRHRNDETKLDKYDNSALFKSDSCFTPENGLANKDHSSFQLYNNPGHFLRHKNSLLRIEPDDGSGTFNQDATFQADHCDHDDH